MIVLLITGFLFYLLNELEESCIKSKLHGQWLDSSVSWRNKWADGLPTYETRWYYFGYRPAYKERFVFSSTLFVFVTDGEHFFQLIKKLVILIGLAYICLQFAGAFLVGTLLGGIVKEVLFSKLD